MDVVLVLLIIFMLTAHVMEFGIEVDVPKVRAVKDTAQEMPVVTITKDGTTYLNGKPVNINDLNGDHPARRFAKAKGVYVRADKETIWDPVAQVMAELGEGRFQVNMVTQPEDIGGQRAKVMAPHADILDQPEPLREPLRGLGGAACFGGGRWLLGSAWFRRATRTSSGATSTAAGWDRWRSTRWRAFRCRAESGPVNPVANDTESLAPTPPPNPRPRRRPR